MKETITIIIICWQAKGYFFLYFLLIVHMTTKIAVIAITKNGIAIARRIKEKMPGAEIYVPAKHSDGSADINWFSEHSTQLVAKLFTTHDALFCIFSLGAVIRMVAPHLIDKK